VTGASAALARISRLSLVGLAKNVGKTTATNALLQALLDEGFYEASWG
jgi:dethiobiotin synthetase